MFLSQALQPVGEPSNSRGSRLRRLDLANCPVCSRAMEPGELLSDHLLTHLAPGLRCVQCGLVTSSHQQMRDHWAFTWRCDCAACDTHVGRGSRLLQHIIEDHDGVSWERHGGAAGPSEGVPAVVGVRRSVVHRIGQCHCSDTDPDYGLT